MRLIRKILELTLYSTPFWVPFLGFGCHATPNPPPPPKDWLITVTFNYDFTNFVPCSGTVTKGCISGFTWGYVEGGTNFPLKTSLPAICTGTTNPKPCTDTANSTLGIGPWNAYVVATGIDNNGAVVSSLQANSPVATVVIGNPTNVTATAQ